MAFDDLNGVVGRAAVYDQHFQVGVALVEQAVQRRFDEASLVVGRDDDANAGPGVHVPESPRPGITS